MQISLFPDDREREKRSRIYGTVEYQQAYAQYIRSPEWRKSCKLVKERARGKCERCGKTPLRFSVHHRDYKNFRNESLKDLEGLCPECHVIADKEREHENHQNFLAAGEEARRENAQNTYFTKKYGEDWRSLMHSNFEDLNREFEEWMQEKEESGDDYYCGDD